MRSWFVLGASAAWKLAFAIVLAGFVCVLAFVCQSLTGLALLPDALPQIPGAWLDATASRLPFAMRWLPRALPAALPFAIVCFGAMVLAAALARRQTVALEAARRDAEDRQRRVRQYAGEVDSDGRMEPYIGSDVTVVGFEPEESYRFVTDERSPAPDNAVSRERATSW
ncbi:MAG: hypothetical protein JF611_15935 [Betaproteobacteria bacterium]|nr:hypothetical protein [Betaproteobacteria bacterium]